MNSINTLITTLSHICRQKLFEEKWLIAPTRRVGYQWIDQISASGQPVLNVRVDTVRGIVLDLMSDDLQKMGVRLLSSLDGVVLLSKIWKSMETSKGYLTTSNPGLAFFQKLYSSLQAVRDAGLDAQSIAIQDFEVEKKGEEFVFILSRFLEELQNHQLIDYAGVIHLAIRKASEGKLNIPDGVLVLIPPDLRMRGLEQRFYECIQSRIRMVSIDLPYPSKARECKTNLDLLQWLPGPGQAPKPVADDPQSLRIFHAVGECNEIREIFRHCLLHKIPLDQVEIVCSDPETYIPLIYELSESWLKMEGHSGVPITYADGIPAGYSRPGRALVSWIDWIQNNFPQSTLIRMIQDGLVQISSENKSFNESQICTWFRRIPVGFGRGRYNSLILEEIQSIQNQMKSPVDLRDGEDEPDFDTHTQRLAARLEGLQFLQEWLQHLFFITPADVSDAEKLLSAADAFIKDFASVRNEFDQYSQNGFVRDIARMQKWVSDEAFVLFDIPVWLKTLPSRSRIQGLSPKHGCLHVSALINGGHSGRKHTFIVGLDDGRFPGSAGADPILLDEEREKISHDLMTKPRRLTESLEQFYYLLCRLRGNVSLSFSSYHLSDEREMYPSPVVFSAYRILSGETNGDWEAMMRWLGRPVSFAPDNIDAALSKSEWWLAKLCGERYANIDELLYAHYPHLMNGAIALSARREDVFSEYDGKVPQAGKATSFSTRREALSASMLETFGRCPLAWFFKYMLRIAPPDELQIDSDAWLPAMEYGRLLHELFQYFLQEKIQNQQPVVYEQDSPRLLQLLDSLIEKYKKRIPPPCDSVFQKQVEELHNAAAIFLREEENTQQEKQPVYLEAAIGMARQENEITTPLDTSEPVLLELGGLTLLARGRIDRIDRLLNDSEPAFEVWDYKTGGLSSYKKNKKQKPPFKQGRLIQPFLYLRLAENRLRNVISPDVKLERFGYFFPGAKGQGERLAWTAQEMTKGLNILERFSQLASMGSFIATNEPEDCKYCDYRKICGNPDETTLCSQQKLSNPFNTVIRPFAELRNDE